MCFPAKEDLALDAGPTCSLRAPVTHNLVPSNRCPNPLPPRLPSPSPGPSPISSEPSSRSLIRSRPLTNYAIHRLPYRLRDGRRASFSPPHTENPYSIWMRLNSRRLRHSDLRQPKSRCTIRTLLDPIWSYHSCPPPSKVVAPYPADDRSSARIRTTRQLRRPGPP